MGLSDWVRARPVRRPALGQLLLALAVMAFLLLVPMPERWHGHWQSTFGNLMHVPLFAGLTLYLSWLLRCSWYWPALIALMVAGLAEWLQEYSGRSGSVLDFIRGALGVFAAVVGRWAWQGPRTLPRLSGAALVLVGLLLWPVAEALPRLLDAYEGYQSLPTLADFQTERQLLRWHCQQSVLIRVPDPKRPGHWLGQLDLLPGLTPYPGAMLSVLNYDWRSYQRLCWSFSCEETFAPLVFSVRSGRDEQNRSNHAQVECTFVAGSHVVKLDLSGLAQQGHDGPLDLSNIRSVQIFSLDLKRAKCVHLQRVWLE